MMIADALIDAIGATSGGCSSATHPMVASASTTASAMKCMVTASTRYTRASMPQKEVSWSCDMRSTSESGSISTAHESTMIVSLVSHGACSFTPGSPSNGSRMLPTATVYAMTVPKQKMTIAASTAWPVHLPKTITLRSSNERAPVACAARGRRECGDGVGRPTRGWGRGRTVIAATSSTME